MNVLLGLVLYLLYAAPWCFVFAKTGKRWWVALLPVINVLVILRIAGRPWWWLLLLLIPLVGIAVWTVTCLDVSERFGHGVPFTIGLVFAPFVFAVWLGMGPDVDLRQIERSVVRPFSATMTAPEPDQADQTNGPGQTDQRIGAGE